MPEGVDLVTSITALDTEDCEAITNIIRESGEIGGFGRQWKPPQRGMLLETDLALSANRRKLLCSDIFVCFATHTT